LVAGSLPSPNMANLRNAVSEPADPSEAISAHYIHCDMNPKADSTVMFKRLACQHANHFERAAIRHVIICRIRFHMQCLVRRWQKDARRLSWVRRCAPAQGGTVRISAAVRTSRGITLKITL
jgi:hypothetical protein